MPYFIAGLLDKETVKRFREIAKSLGLDALVETHKYGKSLK